MPVLFAWDMDGTLLQGMEHDFIEQCDTACRTLRLKRTWSLRELLPVYGLPLGEVLRALWPKWSDATRAKFLETFLEQQPRAPLRHTKPMEHAHFVLQTIKNCGGLNLIVTNTREGAALDTFIRIGGFAPYVDEVSGITPRQEHTANGNGHKAAAAKAFAQKRGCERVVLIGDHAEDIAAGKAIGAITVLFKSGAGHADAGADHVIGDLRKVLQLLPAGPGA